MFRKFLGRTSLKMLFSQSFLRTRKQQMHCTSQTINEIFLFSSQGTISSWETTDSSPICGQTEV